MNNHEKILIIGASGFLGNYLFNNLYNSQIVGTCYTNKVNKLIYLNVLNYQQLKHLILQFKPNIIIYAAGITDSCWSENNKKISFKINAYVIKYILQLNLKCKFIYFSTDYVFDGSKKNYENSKTNPLNIYGKSKALGEFFVKKYSNNYVICRVSGLYHHKFNKLNTFKKISEDNRFSNPIHIKDILNIISIILKKDLRGIFNLFGPDELSRYEFTQYINMNSLNYTKVYPSYYHNNQKIQKPMYSNMKTNRKNHLQYNINSIHKYNSKVDYKYNRDNIDIFLEKNDIKIIFIDTIGGLLTKRRWKEINKKYTEIDNLCGKITRENEFLLRNYDNTLEEVALKISSLYTINPYIWEKVKRWRGKYKLILVNNGWNKTFNLWKEKYGLNNYFDETVNSYEKNIRKENPIFFSSLIEKYDVNVKNALLLDDDKNILNIVKKNNINVLMMDLTLKFPLDEYKVKI